MTLRIPIAMSFFDWRAACPQAGVKTTRYSPRTIAARSPHFRIRMLKAMKKSLSYVLEGYPEAWINGYLWKLEPGDSVGFPAGTGVCHTFINNTSEEVRLLVVGEANKKTIVSTTR